ncbi:hypothetical protein POSPLADRAFT_1071347 [Postia placenta MAD-698-R-SB12]|uniref:Oxidoreductase N-terminal domain-containing protein n=1 Tax=Postia placenta MAD-698-R-SB12 TaxID=670580 RepID=A0A1X6MQY7_9APHY|nr:hypothetical protein POSPLADRAFT_1071347 [Postia placenta MAD-698-R-SB12]OSX58592.1 hypothetical protein POSPLADRAFT_1071347 [Postia placenta MAD-698-R-SB12]
MVPLNGGFLVKTLVVSIEPLILRKMKLLACSLNIVCLYWAKIRPSPTIARFIGAMSYGQMNTEKRREPEVITPQKRHIPPSAASSGNEIAASHLAYCPQHACLWITDAHPRSISNFGVGVVLRSEDSAIKPGDHVYSGDILFQEYFVATDASLFQVLENKENLPWSVYVGVCGMPGQTAHHGWREFAHAPKGKVAFVSSGAGPVGATVIQLAKQDGLKNLVLIVVKELQILGFLSSSLQTKHLANFYREIPPAVARGEIKYFEDRRLGLENVGETILDMLTGQIKGKSVIVVSQK